ncbi:MAG TPA: hypothetical protein GXX38_00115, partial [Clostridia bacterium]|nr:hypothetical protein [Clostridia bacterium]
EKQIMAKVLSGVAMGLVGLLVLIIAALVLLSPPLYLVLLTLIAGVIGIFFTSFLGMLIDLHFPKLDWDNEQKAVKQNFNSVINMFLSLLFAGISLLLVFIFRLKLPLAFLLIVAVYGLLDLLLYRILLTRGAKQLAEMEG